MGIWILNDNENDRTVLYDSCVERPFGHGFYSPEEAENFLRYAQAIGCRNKIQYGRESDFEHIHDMWCRLTKCSECFESVDIDEMNELIDEDDDTFMERMEAHVADDTFSHGKVPNWSCVKCKERNARHEFNRTSKYKAPEGEV